MNNNFTKSAMVLIVGAISVFSNHSPIFLIGKNIPLDTYRYLDSTGSTTFFIRKDVRDYIYNHSKPLLVFVWKSGSISIIAIPDSSYNVSTQSISFHNSTLANAKATISTDTCLWANELPIATHWDTAGRGNFNPGASGGLCYMDLDTSKEETAMDAEFTISNLFDTGTYYYNTGRFSLLSSSSPDANDSSRVPSYECYIGERYSTHAISDLIVMKRANEILAATHRPARFWNHLQFCSENSRSLLDHLSDSLPIFQIINDIIVTRPEDIGGYASSLATVILPPYWRKYAIPNSYSILFNSYYDLNANAFSLNSFANLCFPISAMIDSSLKSAIGIFWNGGGARGTYSQQNSVFLNANYIFNTAASILHADPNSIVSYGYSRSAHFPLYLASQVNVGYKFKFLFAHCPTALDFSRQIYYDDYLTYPSLAYATQYSTGYSYSWRTGWSSPDSINARDLSAKNNLGDTGKAYASSRSITSETRISTLKQNSTRLFLRFGTFDPFSSYSMADSCFHLLKDNLVYLQIKVFHQAGHTVNDYDDLAKALRSIALNRDLFLESDPNCYSETHYQKSNQSWSIIPARSTRTRPFVFEGPVLGVRGRKIQANLTGEPGWQYSLIVILGYKIKDTIQINDKNIIRDTVADSYNGSAIDTVYHIRGTIPNSGNLALQGLVNPDSISWPTTVSIDSTGNANDAFTNRLNVYRLFYRQNSDSVWIPITKAVGAVNERFRCAVLYICGSQEPYWTGVYLSNSMGKAYGLSEF